MGKFIDTIRLKRKPRTRRKIPIWIAYFLIFIVLGLASFFYFGRLGAEFVLGKIDPIALFRDGQYLILFQNNAELRSSGGFIGSYAVTEIEDFEIKNLSFNTNIFALDRQFTDQYFVPAPAPLAKFLKGKSWALRDSNYDASFPEAAEDILNFYTRETGDRVDGIIALNSQVMVDCLKLTGPIYLDKYDLTVNAENFYDVTQYQVEKAYFDNPENWVINEPKTFLKDLYPEIINQALKDKLVLAKLLKKELEQKEIILYFTDPLKQQMAEEQNFAGKIPTKQELKDLFETGQEVDYLYINSNSYSGDKSSIKIKESIDYEVTKNDQGNLQTHLKITRVHTGTYLWPDGPNDNWLRVFVPAGAMLVGAKLNQKDISQRITVGQEAEKTFFGWQVFTNPGQASILEFSYLLPFKTDSYHLLVQKQPGTIGDELSVIYDNGILYNGLLDTDKKL